MIDGMKEIVRKNDNPAAQRDMPDTLVRHGLSQRKAPPGWLRRRVTHYLPHQRQKDQVLGERPLASSPQLRALAWQWQT